MPTFRRFDIPPGSDDKMKYFISHSDSQLTISAFLKWYDSDRVWDYAPVSWNSISSSIDLYGHGTNINWPDNTQAVYGLPNQPADDVYIFSYKTTIDPAVLGHDEFVDYGILDVQTMNNRELKKVANRFAETAIVKAETSTRYRDLTDSSAMINVFMPFANIANSTIDVQTDPSQVVEGITFDEEYTWDNIPQTGMIWKNLFWHVHQTDTTVTCAADGYCEIPFKLRWNADDSDCQNATTLKIDDVMGYTPYSRVTVASDGTGSVKVGALGLVAGDTLKVKLNGDLVTGLGELTATVV